MIEGSCGHTVEHISHLWDCTIGDYNKNNQRCTYYISVCKECYDPKHPQLEPRRNVSDAIALYQPRPTPDDQFGVYLGVVGDSALGANGMKPVPLAAPTVAYTFTGNLTVTIT